MPDDPLDAVYSYVERAYIRLQAGDVLMRCLDEGTPEPIHQMVEGLILAGPGSLATLQEILAETSERKTQVLDDLHQVFSELETAFRKTGLDLGEVKDIMPVMRLSKLELRRLLREHGIRPGKIETKILHYLEETRDLIAAMSRQIRLLEEIEQFLSDWVWGLAYETAHQPLKAKGLQGERTC
jgi:hypothetical protein